MKNTIIILVFPLYPVCRYEDAPNAFMLINPVVPLSGIRYAQAQGTNEERCFLGRGLTIAQ